MAFNIRIPWRRNGADTTSVGIGQYMLSALEFAAVDVETTGLYPGGHDRVVELGITFFNFRDGIHNRFESLINPQRDVGPTHIHGLEMSVLSHAPTFDLIAADVLKMLSGRVIVAHNASFDVRFLQAELARCEMTTPDFPHVCTMTVAVREGFGRRLPDVCRAMSIEHLSHHHAAGDSQAAAEILIAWFRRHSSSSSLTLRDVGHVGDSSWAAIQQPEVVMSALPRSRAEAVVHASRGYLSSLVERLEPSVGDETPETASYLDFLDRALEDRQLSRAEAEILFEIARDAGLSPEKVRACNREYFDSVVKAAWHDGHVSRAEARDIRLVAEFLQIPPSEVESAISIRPQSSKAEKAGGIPPGTTICFTGDLQCRRNGVQISREMAVALAEESGLVVKGNVSKKLEILVVADPDSVSTKARRARELGTRVMAETVFWSAIGVTVD